MKRTIVGLIGLILTLEGILTIGFMGCRKSVLYSQEVMGMGMGLCLIFLALLKKGEQDVS